MAVLGDVLDEYHEAFSVSLSNPVNAPIDVGRGFGRIADDDALPTLAAAGCSVTEGNNGSTPCTFTLTLAPASGRTVTVDYATADGSAAAGADYTAVAGIVTFPPGVTRRTVSVDVLADLAPEGNESFTLLASPFNATGGGAATGSDHGRRPAGQRADPRHDPHRRPGPPPGRSSTASARPPSRRTRSCSTRSRADAYRASRSTAWGPTPPPSSTPSAPVGTGRRAVASVG